MYQAAPDVKIVTPIPRHGKSMKFIPESFWHACTALKKSVSGKVTGFRR